MTNSSISNKTSNQSAVKILSEMSDFLTGSLDVTEAMQLALDSLVDYLGGALSIGITILENDDQELVIKAQRYTEPNVQFEVVGMRFYLSEMSTSRYVIENCRYVLIPDTTKQEFENKRAVEAVNVGVRSILYVPLIVRAKAIGVLHVDVWYEPRAFSQEEIYMCQGVANLVAAAVENGRLLAAERKQLFLAQTLQKVGSLLTSQLSLAELYEQIFELLSEVVTYDSVSIQLFDEQTGEVKLVAAKGFDVEIVSPEDLDDIAQHSLKKFSTGKQVSVISDTWQSELWIVKPEIANIRSWIGALLRVKGKVIGVLNVDSHTTNAFRQEDGDLVAAFANQAAIAIENTRLYKETDRKATELLILHQVAMDTASVTDLDELYSRVTAVITATLYPENFGFILKDEASEQLFPHPSYHGVPEDLKEEPVSMTDSLVGWVINRGESKILDDVRLASHYMATNDKTLSEVMVPIKIEEEVIGVLNAESSKYKAFTQEDVVFLTTLAGLIGVNVARARLYQQLQSYSENLVREVSRRTAELKVERDLTGTILENAGESILLLDSTARIIYVNPAMETQSGYTRGQLMGETLAFLESGLTREAAFNELWQMLVKGQAWSGELINKRQDGSFYDVAMTMVPVSGGKDSVTGFVVVESDITRMKEIERLRTKFVTNVTHELRTPLTNIKTYVTLAERGHEEKKKRYFQILHHETDRLTQLIQDLLDLSHLETESMPKDLKPVKLGEIVQEFVEIFQAKAVLKDIHLYTTILESDIFVSIEDKHLGQLLTNLLGNAINYTPNGGEVLVDMGQDVINPNLVWFRVADSGNGIPTEEIPHLFDRFYRGEYGRSEGIPGTGLGLAICQEIVNRYQGKILIDSDVGQGTQMIVYLPIVESFDVAADG